MLKGNGEIQRNIQPHAWKLILGGAALLVADLFLGFRFGPLAVLLATLFALVLGLAWFGWFSAQRYQAEVRSSQQQAKVQAESTREALAAAQERLLVSERQRSEEKRRLSMLIQLNHAMVEAADEHALMESALSSLTGLVGALGCSFVPVDEWDQPLPAFTYGQLPEPVLRAWASHLTTNMLRERCGSCKLLVGPIGECPLHPGELGDSMRVFCVPVTSANGASDAQTPVDVTLSINSPRPSAAQRMLGVLHLYLPAGRVIDPDMRAFLDGVLQEIFLAYENVRLRSQEVSTLRQLQMLHAPENDFIASLRAMLEGLQHALEADCVLIRLRPSADERLSNLNLLSGSTCELEEEQIEAIFTHVVAGAVVADPSGAERAGAQSEPGSLPVWVGLPLTLPDGRSQANVMPAGHVLGMLMVGITRPYEFHPRQMAILHTVAAQSALLIENERLIRSLEYKVVIQERARLAREIHDGLAQTLAYLKMQSAQMQSYMAQGDMARLSQVLKDNYQALAEAYLDTRQAIDNLRLTPQEGLHTWLERILREFENSANLRVERRIQSIRRPITPEVQAQLIRIVQETLSNVRKHSRARSVLLDLHEWKGDLILEVHDDGLGFDADDIPDISRHGLRGMRERAEMIGADFQIISQAHQGTTMRLVLPALLEEESLQ